MWVHKQLATPVQQDAFEHMLSLLHHNLEGRPLYGASCYQIPHFMSMMLDKHDCARNTSHLEIKVRIPYSPSTQPKDRTTHYIKTLLGLSGGGGGVLIGDRLRA